MKHGTGHFRYMQLKDVRDLSPPSEHVKLLWFDPQTGCHFQKTIALHIRSKLLNEQSIMIQYFTIDNLLSMMFSPMM